MVRRMMILLLALLFLFTWGCTKVPSEADMKAPVKFYYKVSDDRYGETESAIEYELYDADGHETNYGRILDAYFQGPKSDGLAAPFPKATGLRIARIDDSTMHIDLSEDFSLLSGIDLTLACSCITMTCLQFPGVESVTIRSLGRLLDGKETISMNADSLILEDLGPASTTSSYQLYFSDTDNRYLIAEELQLDMTQEELPRYLLDMLIQGPEDAGLAQTVPLNTKVQNLGVTDGICNVDLSAEFLLNSPKTELAQRMTILSLTNTMTQLEGIDFLVLYVDGERLERYGAMELTDPLTFEAGAIGPARVSLNETDADLYLYSGSSELLSRVPTRVRQSADKLAAEQALDVLLTRVDQNGYHSFIPAETSLLDVYLERNICVVVFTPEFLETGENLQKAVRVVCATIMASGDYDAVEIRVDGLESEKVPELLGQPVMWDPSWFSEGAKP